LKTRSGIGRQLDLSPRRRAGPSGKWRGLGGRYWAIKLDEIAAALAACDKRIETLEMGVAKQAAVVGKLEVKILQAEVDRDRERGKLLDLPALSAARRGFN
jgi:hypothetical protein